MARGWESKSVEEQQASLLDQVKQARIPLNPEQAEQQRHREGLGLSRTRLLAQLKTAQNPRLREMLQSALADLDTQISRLG